MYTAKFKWKDTGPDMPGIIAQEMNDIIPEAVFTVSDTQVVNPDITFHCGKSEMLKVAEDGFYVRGVRVDVDDKEAESVYKAFKQWLVWQGLSRE